MGKLTISMVIFNSYVKLPQGLLKYLRWFIASSLLAPKKRQRHAQKRSASVQLRHDSSRGHQWSKKRHDACDVEWQLSVLHYGGAGRGVFFFAPAWWAPRTGALRRYMTLILAGFVEWHERMGCEPARRSECLEALQAKRPFRSHFPLSAIFRLKLTFKVDFLLPCLITRGYLVFCFSIQLEINRSQLTNSYFQRGIPTRTFRTCSAW